MHSLKFYLFSLIVAGGLLFTFVKANADYSSLNQGTSPVQADVITFAHNNQLQGVNWIDLVRLTVTQVNWNDVNIGTGAVNWTNSHSYKGT